VTGSAFGAVQIVSREEAVAAVDTVSLEELGVEGQKDLKAWTFGNQVSFSRELCGSFLRF